MIKMNPEYVPLSSKKGGLSVSFLLGVSPSTVKRIIKRDCSFPRPIIVSSNCHRYKVEQVIAWADGRRAHKSP